MVKLLYKKKWVKKSGKGEFAVGDCLEGNALVGKRRQRVPRADDGEPPGDCERRANNYEAMFHLG